MSTTSLRPVELFRCLQTIDCPIMAAGVGGLATLLWVAPCVASPALLALPAIGFVALVRYGWKHERRS